MRAFGRSFLARWNRQVFLRAPHPTIQDLFSAAPGTAGSGIYLIGCGAEVIYIGQSWHLAERPFDSLGRFYHRLSDTSLPWALAIAPCEPAEMDERESTAIRTFAPRFNTSIPSIPKSQGRLPETLGVAPLLHDQHDSGSAFEPAAQPAQAAREAKKPSPPLRRGQPHPTTRPRAQ